MPYKGKDIAGTVKATLEKALSQRSMFAISQRHLAPKIHATIDMRTQRGLFLGGSHANKGYSTSPLPAFFFGNMSKSGGGYKITDPSGDRGAVTIPDSEIQWGRKYGSGAGATAWVKGGYKKFRELSGRNTGKVDLTWSGELLRQLQAKPKITAKGASIYTGVNGSRESIAYWLDKKRHFIGLSEPEMDSLERDIANEIRRLIEQMS